MRRPGLRATTAAFLAILASVGLTLAATAPAQAASKQLARVALPSTSPISIENVYILDHSGDWCLDGRLGNNGVTMQPCGSDGTHQIWTRLEYPGYDIYENQFNFFCLDGRLSAVTLQECGTDGTHQDWVRILAGGGVPGIEIWNIENLFNAFCLDNRPLVTLQQCGTDGTYQVWLYSKQGN